MFGLPGLLMSGVLTFILYTWMKNSTGRGLAGPLFFTVCLIWFIFAACLVFYDVVTPDLMTEEEVLACIQREENVVVEQLGTIVCDDYKSSCRLERASFSTVEGQRGTVFYDDADCSIDW